MSKKDSAVKKFLTEANELLIILDTAPIGILIFNDEERIVYANQLAEQYFCMKLTEPGKIKCGDFIECKNRHLHPKGCGQTKSCQSCALLHAIRSAFSDDQHSDSNVNSGDALIERDPDLGPIWVKYNAGLKTLGGDNIVILSLDDITERKNTEYALQESESRYKTLVDNINIGVAVYRSINNGEDFIFVDLNKAGEHIEKVRKKDLIGKSVLKIFPGIREFGLFNVFQTVWKTGRSASFPVNFYKDKRLSGWRDNFVYRLPSGEIVAVYSDETARKQAEEALHLKYSVVEQSMDGIICTDDAFRITYMNKAAETLFGWSLNEIKGKTPLIFNSEPYTEDPLQKVHNRLSRENPYEGVELNKRKDGSTFYCQFKITPIRNEHGKIYAHMGSHRDISELIIREKELAKSEERYRALYMHNPIQTIIVDNEGKIMMYNFAKKKSGGRLPQIGDVMYKDYASKHEINMFEELMECIKSSKQKEYSGLKYNNQYIDIKISPFSEGAIITTNDVTEMKRLYEQLQQKKKMEAMGTLAGGIAHEFNNLLGIIIGNTELAFDVTQEQSFARDCLEEIQTASLRAKDVVQQILSFAHKAPLTHKPIKIGAIVLESLKLIRSTIPASIEIRQEILCDSDVILGNPTEINQIIMNLFNNSVHAIEDETGTLEARLESIVLDSQSVAQYENLTPGNYAKFSLTDTGTGIAPEIINRIFDPYFTTKDVDKGLGMGLAVVYGLVKKHNGAIKVLSKPGEGSTFEILFPLNYTKIEPEVNKSGNLPTGSERILFVDDEESIVKMAVQILERQGYKVVGLTKSPEAVKLFREQSNNFDLVITDTAMPDMPGDRLAKEFLRIRPNMPIVIVTGHSDRIDEKIAETLGASAYARKPLMKNDFLKLIRRVLDEDKDNELATFKQQN